MLESLLLRLGLEPGESTTYLTLLASGPLSAGTLAKKTGIVRVTQYLFLKRLIEKGFVTQSMKNGLKFFTAVPSEKVLHIYEERIASMEHDRASFSRLIETFTSKHADGIQTPKFRIFEGTDQLKQILKDMLLYRDMETQAYWPIKKMVEILSPEFFEQHNRERIRRNLYTRAIWPQDQGVDVKHHPYLGSGEAFKREIRIAPKSVHFTMGYWIYGNNVAFLSSHNESYGFIIESVEFRQMLLSQFEMIWKMSKPTKSETLYTRDFLKTI